MSSVEFRPNPPICDHGETDPVLFRHMANDVIALDIAQRLEQGVGIGDTEFLEQLGPVHLDRAVRYIKLERDFLAGQPIGKIGNDLAFATGSGHDKGGFRTGRQSSKPRGAAVDPA